MHAFSYLNSLMNWQYQDTPQKINYTAQVTNPGAFWLICDQKGTFITHEEVDEEIGEALKLSVTYCHL